MPISDESMSAKVLIMVQDTRLHLWYNMLLRPVMSHMDDVQHLRPPPCWVLRPASTPTDDVQRLLYRCGPCLQFYLMAVGVLRHAVHNTLLNIGNMQVCYPVNLKACPTGACSR
ncbi:hypothetical protein MTO96_051248 [Rhipicephalus appendiculatus]